MLHTVNKPHPSPAFDRALELASVADGSDHALLLMEGGVYQALARHPSSDAIRSAIVGGVKVYALRADVEARGLSKRVLPEVQLISDAQWVQLVAQQELAIAWF